MIKHKIPLIFIISLFLVGGVYASEFNINSITKQSSGTPYRGDSITYKGIIQSDSGNVCKLECSYNAGTDAGYVSDSGSSPATQLNAGQSQEFPFEIKTSGNSPMSIDLILSCKQITAWNCWSADTISHSRQISISFLFPGDGICTTSNEKCNDYSNFLGTSDCSCSSSKECRPNGNRNPDSKGCQTYCGNGICEKLEGESCSSCQNDCKKCDLSTCTIGNECEGGYCVWNICWNSATRINDGHCDLSKGENCGNSPADCACQTGQRCSTTTNQCETYCGNGVCESNENGICKADCKWCGDDSCDASQKESCTTCELDCGICESQKVNEEIQQKTKEVVKTSLKEVSDKQKIITYSGIGSIVLVIIGYIVFKIIKSKKTKKTQPLTEKKEEEKPIKKKVSKKKRK